MMIQTIWNEQSSGGNLWKNINEAISVIRRINRMDRTIESSNVSKIDSYYVCSSATTRILKPFHFSNIFYWFALLKPTACKLANIWWPKMMSHKFRFITGICTLDWDPIYVSFKHRTSVTRSQLMTKERRLKSCNFDPFDDELDLL